MKYICKIERPEIDANAIYGFVLDESDDFVLVAQENDFLLDGYLILKKQDITKCKPTKTTRYCTKLMRKEGHVNIDPPHLPIESWKSALSHLRNQKLFVSIENEVEEEYLIGPIKRLNKNSVVIAYFDGTGQWKEPRTIQYENITAVSFLNRYITMHQKYITDQCAVEAIRKD